MLSPSAPRGPGARRFDTLLRFAAGAAKHLLIGAGPPIGVGHDRLAADLVEGDVLGRVARRRSDADGRE